MTVEGRTYIPLANDGICNICAVCMRGCPAEAIAEQREEESSLRGAVYAGVETPLSIGVDTLDTPACEESCPIHQDVKGFISLIAERKFRGALELIRETNSRQKAYRLGKKFVQKAKDSLDILPKNEWNTTLKELADFILERAK